MSIRDFNLFYYFYSGQNGQKKKVIGLLLIKKNGWTKINIRVTNWTLIKLPPKKIWSLKDHGISFT